MLYDGECSFCRRWAARVRHITHPRVDFISYQRGANRFPEIPEESFATAIKLIDTAGEVYSGAEAIFKALSFSPYLGWLYWLYKYLPPFRWIAKKIYGTVSCAFRRK